MKSAFARVESHTYVYPSPIGDRNEAEQRENPFSVFFKERIDKDVMAEIKAAGREGAPSPAPTVTLRIPRSKADRDAIAEAGQSVAVLDATGTEGLQQVTKQRLGYANRAVFDLLCEEWTGSCFGDEKPSGDAFGRCDVWTSDWLTACILDVQDRAAPDFQEAQSSGNSSSGTRRSGRAGSRKASASA